MNYRTFIGALLGLGASISYYALLSFSPLANHVDSGIYAGFIELRHQEDHSEKVVIFGIDNIVGGVPQYAALLKDLLSVSQADVVVINPPRHWYDRVENQEGGQLREVVRQYQNRIVLASMTAPVDTEYKTSVTLYNYMIEQAYIDGSYKPEVEAEKIHGFFEFAYQAGPSGRADSPVHRHSLEGEFIRDDDSEDIDLKSVASLVFDKSSQGTDSDVPTFRRNNFLTSAAKIQTPIRKLKHRAYDLSEECKSTQVRDCRLSEMDRFADLSGKFVLFGHTNTDRNAAEVHAMPTTKGMMSAAEIQANQIIGLQTEEVYLQPKGWFVIVIVGMGGICFGRVITVGIYGLIEQKSKQTARKTILYISGLFSCYALIVVLGLFLGVLFPISAPIISWVIAILTASFILLYRDQRLMVERQLSAERKDVIDEASKQLHDIAGKVHQDALHHLKLAMDWLEMMQIQSPACDLSIPLEKIVKASESIRTNLIATRLCAEKLPISSELRMGLHMAIRLHTRRLKKKGELTLTVEPEVNPIKESVSDRWIEAREGIFSFYQESINNIIHHAQPPKGSATRAEVLLERIADTALLRVTNDGGFSSTYLEESTESFGTEVMEKVASRLPEGRFSRKVSDEGDFQVELSWSMKGFL